MDGIILTDAELWRKESPELQDSHLRCFLKEGVPSDSLNLMPVKEVSSHKNIK